MSAFCRASRCGATCALVLSFTSACGAQVGACSDSLSHERQRELVDYVQKRYRVPEAVQLSLIDQKMHGQTCYHELTFNGATGSQTWRVKLFLSPDTRFLTSDLFDTFIDPEAEERAKNAAVMSGLSQVTGAVRGPEGAAVVIVVFSDFECPYCRAAAGYLNQALADGAEDVRVVFHHMPLAGHAWARFAAEAAACAQSQSSSAFWRMHDEIFRSQQELNASNVREKVLEVAARTGMVDMSAFRACLNDGTATGLVLRDLNLARSVQVTATPTLFVNGTRVAGIESAAKLRGIIEVARKEAAAVVSHRQPDGSK